MKEQKKLVSIQDISCTGRCSLTVALPILSASGHETAIIPTAVLSTHTGGFTNFTYCDLTNEIEPITKHWKELNINYDAIYTGYLGSFDQLKLVTEFFDAFGTNDNLIFIDPAMADNGKLYSGFTKEFVKGMAQLCSKADLIVPNLTEAAFLLDEEYKQGPYTREYIEDILKRLSKLGPKKVVLTGVHMEPSLLGAATYEKESGNIGYAFTSKIDGYFHGTGDIFASALLAALMNEKSLIDSAQIAANFVVESIKRTISANTDERYGVNFEQSIPGLIKAMNLE